MPPTHPPTHPQPKNYDLLDVSSDQKEEVAAPEHGSPITAEMKALLCYSEPWTFWPDYERVTMVNRVIR